MKKMFEGIYNNINKFLISVSTFVSLPFFGKLLGRAVFAYEAKDIQISSSDLGFNIPTFAEILSALIKLFFVIAGLAALFVLLTGGLAWVTSGGNKESLEKARERIVQGLTGIIIIVAVLSIIWSLEQIVFKEAICFGISCPVTIPGLLQKCDTGDNPCK